MLQKIKSLFAILVFTTFIFNAFSLPKSEIIKDIKPSTWKTVPIVVGESTLWGKGKYTVYSVSPVLLKGLMMYDNCNNKKKSFKLSFEASEDITLYVFNYGSKNEWSDWSTSKAFIKWEYKKNGKRKVSRYFMPYKKFPKGKVTLEYQPSSKKEGSRPFFIITSKSFLLSKKNNKNSKEKHKLITLKQSDKTVGIDGIIDNKEWENTEKLNLYLANQTGKEVSEKLPKEKTDIFISRDKDNLYIGAKCYKNNGNIILTKLHENVASLWQDECFEIYFKPQKKSAKYIQIMINSLGYYYITGKGLDEEKNVKLKVKTKKYSDRWEIEIAIPLQMLSNSELMGINFCRTTYDSKKGLKERTGWSTTRYDDIDNYGTLFLARNDEKYNLGKINELKAKYSAKIKKGADSYKNIKESPYDFFMLWPKPKFIKKSKGFIKLASLKLIDIAKAPNTASLLKEELNKKYDFVFNGKNNYSLLISPLENIRTKEILKKYKLYNKLKGKHPDSFVIVITDSGILLTGNNNRGIYYAVRAFLNIVDYSTPAGKKPSAACMNIADWPDQKMRIIFWRMDTMKRINPDINMIKRYIKDAIAGSRYNAIVLMMRNGIRYKSHPEIARRAAFTTDEFKDLVAFCRKNYLEPIPGINTPGHAQWIVKRHKELAELNNGTICTRNPASLKLVFDIAQELIDLCGGPGKVKYFHVGGDEIRWEQINKKYKKIKDECQFCKGTPWKDLLLEYIRKEHAFFKKRGIRMITWSDMFYKERNGNHYDTHTILKDLPRDIILSPWSAAGYPPIKKWTNMGFDVIKGATGYKVVSVFDDISIGHMLAYFSRDMWMTFNCVKMSSHNYYNHLSTYLYAANAWNNDLTLKPRNQDEKNNLKTTVQKRGEANKLKFLFKYGNALTYFYSHKRFPMETDKFEEIDISEYCNTNLANCFNAGDMNDLSGLKLGSQIVAGIPTKIKEKIIVLQNNDIKNIKISKKASSILFLYAAYLASKKEKDFIDRIRNNPVFSIKTKRSPIAYYLIKYEDGSKEKVTMNYGFNVGALRPPLHSRYTYDIRYVLRAAGKNQDWPEVQDCRDCSPGAPAVYQYEWVNPYPNKKIVSMDFISMKSEVVPALVALTVRAAK